MVHRPTDSRLLANLLSHEKEYSKQFAAVLETSQASLSSFSAYASASAPPVSQVILTVAGALAGADDALQKYLEAVDEWRDQLRRLKGLESEVGNIVRDREILVTRLIKASKQQKPTREALISGTGSSSSLVFGEGSSKLNVAQSELQACESQLANKERELEVLRLSTVRVGLHARCTAMVNCGWVWGEMGKEGLRALEGLDDITGGHFSPPHSPRLPASSKPLPEPGDAPSDLSSILPSQSASQIALALPLGQLDLKPSDTGYSIPGPSQPYSLAIPPAHSISDHTIPTSAEPPPPPSAEGDSSSEDHGPLEVVENDRFAKPQETKKRKTKTKRRSEINVIRMAEQPALPNGSPVTKYREKDGSRKHGVFGTIAGLFTKSSPKKGWTSRKSRRVKNESSDDDSIRYLAVSPSKQDAYSTGSAGERLKKRKARASTLDHPAFESAGWPTTAGKGKERAMSLDYGQGELSATEDHLRSPRVVTRRRSSSQPHLPLPTEGAPLSRNNSLTTSVASITSAPPVSDSSRTPTPAHRRRSTSISVRTSAKPSPHRRTASGTSVPVNPVHPQTNLMSIVEEAVRVNREARISMNPNNRLESIKAPLSVSQVLKHEAEALQANTQPPPIRSTSPRTPPPKPTRPKALPPRGPENPVTKPTPPARQNGDSNPWEITAASINAPTPIPVDKPLPMKTPLKSALRNPSRTPSPNPLILRPSISSPPPINRISESPEDDTASISSYETVHENLDSRSCSPMVPPKDPVANIGVDSDLSQGTSSTAIASTDAGVPSRRKSVRMSLPPTYSTTPPAREDWEVEKPPWSLPRDEVTWTSRNENAGGGDLWEDSSDEDEEYATARRLLSKLPGRH